MGCNGGKRAREKTHRSSAIRKTEEKLSRDHKKLFEREIQGEEDSKQRRNEPPSCEKNVGTDKSKLRI